MLAVILVLALATWQVWTKTTRPGRRARRRVADAGRAARGRLPRLLLRWYDKPAVPPGYRTVHRLGPLTAETLYANHARLLPGLLWGRDGRYGDTRPVVMLPGHRAYALNLSELRSPSPGTHSAPAP